MDLLVINSQRISLFKSTKRIEDTDLFPITTIRPSGSLSDYKSQKIDYADLANDVIHRDVSQQSYVISSAWTFSEGLSVLNTAPKEDIDVATVSWFYQNCYQKLENLSASIYGDAANGYNAKKLPSYKGMVIVSKVITSETTLKSVYGNDTKWKKIQGRFLLGTGSNLKNTSTLFGNNTSAGNLSIAASQKKGGAKVVSLIEKNIPSHTHRFFTEQVMDKDKVAYSRGTLRYGEITYISNCLETHLEGGGLYGIITSDGVASNPDWGAGFEGSKGIEPHVHLNTVYRKKKKKKWLNAIAVGLAGSFLLGPTGALIGGILGYNGNIHWVGGSGKAMPDMKKWPSFDGSVSIAEIVGGTQEKVMNCQFQAKMTIDDMIGAHNPVDGHDNMPPYMTEYIWERVE